MRLITTTPALSDLCGRLAKHDFVIPGPIKELPEGSNIARDKYYDQIAFHDPRHLLRTTANAGVLDFNKSVFRDEDAESYAPAMKRFDPKRFPSDRKKQPAYYRQWRTFQVSDHLPLWAEFSVYEGGRPGPVAARPQTFPTE